MVWSDNVPLPPTGWLARRRCGDLINLIISLHLVEELCQFQNPASTSLLSSSGDIFRKHSLPQVTQTGGISSSKCFQNSIPHQVSSSRSGSNYFYKTSGLFWPPLLAPSPAPERAFQYGVEIRPFPFMRFKRQSTTSYFSLVKPWPCLVILLFCHEWSINA